MSPVMLGDCLSRIEQLEPTLHAFQSVRAADEVAAEAAGVDPALPLAGRRRRDQDNVDVEGLPTRFGSAVSSDRPAERDDELVRRLRAAGCVVVGKTEMPELAIWPFTEPEAFAAPQNPVRPGRTPGESTGGGAVAVAAPPAR